MTLLQYSGSFLLSMIFSENRYPLFGIMLRGAAMFRKTVQPLDLLLALLAAIVPGAAILYWLASQGRLPFDFMFGVAYLLTAAGVMLGVIGGMIWFATWFFSPRR